MNQLFVPVKVDREERPDVDRIYMDFVVRTSGHGGWPLTVFCTPDGRPFYGGTYFPPAPRHGLPSFREVLTSLGRAWSTRRGEVEESANDVVAQLARRPAGVATQPPGAHSLRDAAAQLLQGADREAGGFGGAPKFPTPTSLEALLAAIDVMSALYAVADVASDVLRRHSAQSDAAALARLTGVPAVVWGVVWIAISIAVLAAVVRRLA
jgi:uncharacterized protein YyaL (SSP411 family)